MRSHVHCVSWTISRYGVKPRSLEADFPRDYPFAATASLKSAAYEEGFPVISRLTARITPDSGNSITRQGISLP